MKKLSIVIPCYNEGENIITLLGRYQEVLKERDDIEIIIVNDGSKDTTKNILDEIKNKFLFLKIINLHQNKGYGGAIVTGLKESSGEYIGWTHGDMQTPPEDVVKALSIIEGNKNVDKIYIKGKRYGRSFGDLFFTLGMSIFETFLFKTILNDINAQPTIFHRSFFYEWDSPPSDFSLDLYSFVIAKRLNMNIVRFPVFFGKRLAGVSSWNTNWKNKLKFIKRTLSFSFLLKKTLK